jgi:hypothetical protein
MEARIIIYCTREIRLLYGKKPLMRIDSTTERKHVRDDNHLRLKSTPVLPRTYLPKDILSPFASKRSGPSDALLAFLPVAVAVAELAEVLPAPVLVLALGEDALDREACWALLASDPLRIGSFAGGWVRFLFDQF